MRSLTLLLALLAAVAHPTATAAQQPPAPRPPREPAVTRPPRRDYPVGERTRFDPRIRSGEDAVARTLEQADCPIALHALSMHHDEGGSTILLRVDNRGEAPVTRYTLAAWVLMPDGTVKGSQRQEQKHTLAPGEGRWLSMPIRTVRVSPSNGVVIAVLQTQGVAWTGDRKAIEREAQATATR